ncbi:hypothetical protein E1212_27190 [Jiangella ureilytica]|uniref:DUF3558 domain-containing protein n=1 Tax=Jiangella ureilytica TaxID=2530374 RepID=A0A4R4RB34_9ACTN|nr:hypothetical protein [Jiangella ureilytica]TDC46296.1 hypothetical protein E1212_27190 [Jiangella ureilytica]
MTSLDRRRLAALAAAVPLLLLPAGCSNGGEPEVPVVPTPGEPTGDSTEAGGEPTASPSSTTGVPELCGDLAGAGDIAQILQVPMQGETVRVYNDEFLPDSGRTGRLTCSYGVPEVPEGQAPPPTPAPVPLEIAVSGYTDAETASGRIESTVDAAQAAAATVTAQPVAGRDGFLLSDPEDVSFVVADDVRTYVITLRHGVVPAAAEPVVLVDLAAHLLGSEPGATTTPGATATPGATTPPGTTATPGATVTP